MTAVKYVPVFVGKTNDDEKIVIYENVDNRSEFHIRIDDGKLRVMSPGTEVESWFEVGEDKMHITIYSPSLSLNWSGKATGTRIELLAEEALRR